MSEASLRQATPVTTFHEHHGDACPGAAAMIMMQGIDDYHRELAARNYRYCKPGIEDEPGARGR